MTTSWGTIRAAAAGPCRRRRRRSAGQCRACPLASSSSQAAPVQTSVDIGREGGARALRESACRRHLGVVEYAYLVHCVVPLRWERSSGPGDNLQRRKNSLLPAGPTSGEVTRPRSRRPWVAAPGDETTEDGGVNLGVAGRRLLARPPRVAPGTAASRRASITAPFSTDSPPPVLPSPER